MQDFEAALDEVQPAFGANTESLLKHVMQVRVEAARWDVGANGPDCSCRSSSDVLIACRNSNIDGAVRAHLC